MKRNRQNNEPKEMVSFDGYKIFMNKWKGTFSFHLFMRRRRFAIFSSF